MTHITVARGIAKTLFLWIHLLVYIVHLSAGGVAIADRPRRRRWRARMTARYSRRVLRHLGFRVRVEGSLPPRNSSPAMIVANHMGYLDILVLTSLAPMVFITSVEVRRTIFLGLLARLGGSLFVERRHRSKLPEELAMIERSMDGGLPVTLFPEATSSNGTTVLPFKASLLEVPCRLGADVIPLCVRYTGINGAPPTARSRDLVAYYGELSFLPHFLKLPFIESIDVSITVLPPTTARGRSRKELCASLYTAIMRAHGG
jgi:1-acyl-sn-glycerol-3-phosphate acyltransferase